MYDVGHNYLKGKVKEQYQLWTENQKIFQSATIALNMWMTNIIYKFKSYEYCFGMETALILNQFNLFALSVHLWSDQSS